ncbi:chorismate mutase aro7 [Exophiala xenobiotica]|uniref:Chorismate mutase n=1 Tax=Vermiconidia calcicola TaxID=1690605 RepID=A0AAV9PS17_9PEZI|nr:chorismate mutase aro7 [Exophiala xenobiotica]KAK5528569.1 chorismate mutase aro7 [Vermiconidia calcicola]KAK5545994.1 chorismate mutase aro7 [Chaetothyriales sp. CCFEE 6169]KAK5267757.1 chorismate mutase aro7 [Exophiala xenobiotica]KAK5292269.1 chorismate mutase aro7 [Exophiala xenobiotica]
MDTALDLSDASKALDLDNIRFQLIRLEDTITFHLIERVQFPLNATIYDHTALPIPTINLALPPAISLLDYLLSETERLHSTIRRYDAPDEYAFFPQVLQRPMLQAIKYPRILHDNDVNVNQIIKEKYINEVLPEACREFGREDRGETKENYGSAATCDVACLQALSRRIHFGKFVAESKFQQETERFVELIKAEDREGIDAAITKQKVEQQVLERLRLKAKTYGKDPSLATNGGVGGDEKINVEAVVKMYAQVVIPLTKVVEVEYLMQRLKGTQWE